jgi:hypothetical protein
MSDHRGSQLRRLGLISKHFPPSEEAGALRWQKLAALAEEHGFSLTVATRAFAELARRDDRRLGDLPAATRIEQVPSSRTLFDAIDAAVVASRRAIGRRGSPQPAAQAVPAAGRRTVASARQASVPRAEARHALASLTDLRRAYHATALRASELAWARAAAAAIERQAEPIGALLTCGPPHQVHLAGSALARRRGIPHIVDMRDPWSLVERVPAPFGSQRLWDLAARDEAEVLTRASLVVVNTAAHADALRTLHPALGERIIAVLNGFDDESVPPPKVETAFTIVYAGTVYLDRDPAMLLNPVAELVRRDGLAPSDLQLVFVGDVESDTDAGLADVAASLGLDGFVQVRGRVSRSEAMTILASADLNVVLPQDSHLAVPSKVYEYLRFPAWMLALAEPHSATAQTLAGTGADVVRPADRAAIIARIAQRIAERSRSGRPAPLSEGAEHLSRRAQAELLFGRIAALMRA